MVAGNGLKPNASSESSAKLSVTSPMCTAPPVLDEKCREKSPAKTFDARPARMCILLVTWPKACGEGYASFW